MAETSVPASQLDWSSFGLNIKSATNTSQGTPVNLNHVNLSSVGASITFTVESDCDSLVTVNVGVISSSDFEHKPGIYKDGSVFSFSSYSAAPGNASGRSLVRSYTALVPLTAGAHTLSAGIFVASATGPTVPTGNANITAIVLGEVSA